MLPPLKVIDTTHPLLGVLDNFGEEISEGRGRDLCSTGLIEMPVVYIWPEIGSWGTESSVDRGSVRERESA